MLYIEKWKKVLIVVVTFLGVAYATPNILSAKQVNWMADYMPSIFPSSTISLGLNLQGGSHILLEADTKTILNERLESIVDAARNELRKSKIGYTHLTTKNNGISFKLRKPSLDKKEAYSIARSLEANAEVITHDDGTIDVLLTEFGIKEINSQVVNQSIEIVRRRVDETGTKEPIIQRQGDNRIVVQLPGIDDPERIKNIIGKTAKMSFHLVDDTSVGNKLAISTKRLPLKDNPSQHINIKKRVIISGDMLVDAQATFQQGSPVVSFRFNAIGAKRFCNVTRDNIKKPFAIVLDDEVISAPVIQDAICGGSGIISGHFTVKGANDLALLLRAGALPAPLNVVEERSVGPTLGSDSIIAGRMAAIIALCFVFHSLLFCIYLKITG